MSHVVLTSFTLDNIKNDQKKKHKRTNNDLLNTTKKTKIKQHKIRACVRACVEEVNRLYNEPRLQFLKNIVQLTAYYNLGEDIGSRGDRGTRLNAGMKNLKISCKPPLSLLIKDAVNSS
jgi:hypothetical protein